MATKTVVLRTIWAVLSKVVWPLTKALAVIKEADAIDEAIQNADDILGKDRLRPPGEQR